ncbi:EAL domain-containing protein [Promicromonospora soli]
MSPNPRGSSPSAGPGPRPGAGTARNVSPVTTRARSVGASVEPESDLAGWAYLLGAPRPESPRSRRLARVGGVVAIGALVAYLWWRITFTMPTEGWDRTAAWVLVAFEAIPVLGLTIRLVTLWNIDCRAPAPVTEVPAGTRVAVLIPTYDEPVEVIAPTIAAACALEPSHETWVLDDGDRDWVAEMCEAYGARYVRRPVHDHAKAGNLNHALGLMAQEAAGSTAADGAAGHGDFDIIAVLDCDHVPLPTFLTATLGWFDDPDVALVQGPQTFYNTGAFDDDGVTGEQGIFFNVQMAARNKDGAGPFWCGSTSLLRTRALREVGGIATETIVEDMHTTLGLIRAGWKTVYHHQALAVGLAPATPEQYLLQRTRWGLGAMQVLAKEHLWAAKSWLSWRNYYEYLSGTVWWLEGVATVAMFLLPAAILLSGAQTSTASAGAFAAVFVSMFVVRLWGVRWLFRHHLHLTTSFGLRVFRIPVGFSCLWWLMTRRTLTFAVTPKAGASERVRGRPPRIVTVLIVVVFAILVYAVAGVLGFVPWRATAGATVASGVWLLLAEVGLVYGAVRVMAPAYASSRRNAHRVAVRAEVLIDGADGELVDLSVGGAAVRVPRSGFGRPCGRAPPSRSSARAPDRRPPDRRTVQRRPDPVDEGGGGRLDRIPHDLHVAVPHAAGRDRRHSVGGTGRRRHPTAQHLTFVRRAHRRAHLKTARIDEELMTASDLERAISHAVDHGELVLHYQPIFRVRTGDLEGFEALVRWDRPGVGLLSPAQFIPAAEESDLICELGTWVLNNATEQAAAWERADGSRRLTIAVNVSGRHINEPRIRDDVANALRRSGLDPGLLVVEITETVLVNGALALENLRQLRRTGVALSLDDLGTGHSTIAEFARLPVDIVKIDRTYLDARTTTSRERFRSMVRTVHAYDLPVVAEGVENADQLELLRDLDVEYAQGFALGLPMTSAEVDDHWR